MSERALLRHALATLAYRASKALRDTVDTFADWTSGPKTRTPVQILAHMGDLMDWALSMAANQQKWHDSNPLPWQQEKERFFAAIARFDDYLASEKPLGVSPERLFQGPVADALTHVGQLTLLRGLAGVPVRGENYAKAAISVGSVTFEQPPPRAEF